jgi:hypothetical protein
MSESRIEGDYLKRPFRIAHLIWAVVGLAASGFLIAFGGQGHPPGIILLPVVWVAWLLGHGGLWMVRRLATRGRSRALRLSGDASRWPPGLILAALGTGIATATGVFPLLLSAAQWREGRFLEPLWIVMAVTWLAHGICFLGLLLRRGWSRVFAALLCFGWAVLLVAQFVDHLARGSRIQTGELVIAAVLIGVGVVFGWHLLASQRIRDFLAAPARNSGPTS